MKKELSHKQRAKAFRLAAKFTRRMTDVQRTDGHISGPMADFIRESASGLLEKYAARYDRAAKVDDAIKRMGAVKKGKRYLMPTGKK